MSKSAKTYSERLQTLLEIIELGRKLIVESKDISESDKKNYVELMNESKRHVNYPEKGYANVRSLSVFENIVMNFWNEVSGPYVEEFWRQISDRGIKVKRKDILNNVLQRKKIISYKEYDLIKDSLIIALQIGKITAEEANVLSLCISNFEHRQSKRKV